MSELEPLEPEKAVELYLKHRSDELAESSLNAHRLRLKHFVRWCREENIHNVNELTGRRLHEYRLWRKDDGGLNRVSVRTQMSTLRALMIFLEQIDAVQVGLNDSVDIPTLDADEGVRSVHIDNEQAQRILSHLEKYEYASLRHVLVLLLWRTAIRTGTARGIDVSDVDLDDGFIEIRHQPSSSTPLKNKRDGERYLNISEKTSSILADWINKRHPETEDDHGRTPLLATNYGRISKGNLRKQVYWATAPQFVGDDCSCDADEHGYDLIHECDDAVSPHALRRGSITMHLREEVPKPVVSERANVSSEVLDAHYNETSLKEQMELRKKHLDNI
ncbi:site-specific integrase [Halorubrum sp. AJ67]|uniref:tyrosine-type recombinase/integrase n=1 Tax=Halorubrum sp. AJ67 TaxID=1173487 RepID=UPI0003DB75A8|nr:site-specific integrase [Halorubrum sp. AJ67]CDK39623.1 phage integrase/site-specific recombinase [Halorubrum sp. AJ67]